MNKQETLEQLKDMRASLLRGDNDYSHLDALVDMINIMIEMVEDKE